MLEKGDIVDLSSSKLVPEFLIVENYQDLFELQI